MPGDSMRLDTASTNRVYRASTVPLQRLHSASTAPPQRVDTASTMPLQCLSAAGESSPPLETLLSSSAELLC